MAPGTERSVVQQELNERLFEALARVLQFPIPKFGNKRGAQPDVET